jgi:hypothetical protein
MQRNSQKTPTMASNSTKKIVSHSLTQNNFYPSRNSFGEDDVVKRKSSLKDLLRQRKSAAKS